MENDLYTNTGGLEKNEYKLQMLANYSQKRVQILSKRPEMDTVKNIHSIIANRAAMDSAGRVLITATVSGVAIDYQAVGSCRWEGKATQ